MQEVTGDLWLHPASVKAITTNGAVRKDGRGVMGRGVALQATQRCPGVAKVLGDHLRYHGNHVGVLGVWADGTGALPFTLVAYPVKHVWNQPANLGLILRSAEELVKLADRYDWPLIALPRPGCGNGRLDWAQVGPLLAPKLDDRFVVVSLAPAQTGKEPR